VAACTTFTPDDSPRLDGGPGEGGASADGALAQDDARPPGPDSAVDAGDGGPDGGGKPIVFVTSLGYAVTTAAQADTICASEAKSRLPGSFRAWFPEGALAAPQRVFGPTTKGHGPWIRPDGVVVAATDEAFVNAAAVPLLAPISVTATMETRNLSTWTGTRQDGGLGIVCPQTIPTKGLSSKLDGAWTDEPGNFTATCDSSLALYCFQVP